MFGRKSWKERYVVVERQSLSYYASETEYRAAPGKPRKPALSLVGCTATAPPPDGGKYELSLQWSSAGEAQREVLNMRVATRTGRSNLLDALVAAGVRLPVNPLAGKGPGGALQSPTPATSVESHERPRLHEGAGLEEFIGVFPTASERMMVRPGQALHCVDDVVNVAPCPTSSRKEDPMPPSPVPPPQPRAPHAGAPATLPREPAAPPAPPPSLTPAPPLAARPAAPAPVAPPSVGPAEVAASPTPPAVCDDAMDESMPRPPRVAKPCPPVEDPPQEPV